MLKPLILSWEDFSYHIYQIRHDFSSQSSTAIFCCQSQASYVHLKRLLRERWQWHHLRETLTTICSVLGLNYKCIPVPGCSHTSPAQEMQVFNYQRDNLSDGDGMLQKKKKKMKECQDNGPVLGNKRISFPVLSLPWGQCRVISKQKLHANTRSQPKT